MSDFGELSPLYFWWTCLSNNTASGSYVTIRPYDEPLEAASPERLVEHDSDPTTLHPLKSQGIQGEVIRVLQADQIKQWKRRGTWCVLPQSPSDWFAHYVSLNSIGHHISMKNRRKYLFLRKIRLPLVKVPSTLHLVPTTQKHYIQALLQPIREAMKR